MKLKTAALALSLALAPLAPVAATAAPGEAPASVQEATPDAQTDRYSGTNRYETSARIALAHYNPGVETVYVASGEEFPDALSGSARAGTNSAPILLTRQASVPGAILQAARTLAPEQIVIFGGETAVSKEVADQLKTVAPVTRIAGENRYFTAAKVAQTFPTTPMVYLASGEESPDALAAGAAAGFREVPLLLTRHDGLPGITASELRRIQPSTVTLVGGTNAVSQTVEEEVRGILSEWGGQVVRVAGDDRYQTAAAVASTITPNRTPWVASGQNFPDALSAAAVAAKDDSAVFLTRPESLPGATAEGIRAANPLRVKIAGGNMAVSPAVEQEIRRLGGFVINE